MSGRSAVRYVPNILSLLRLGLAGVFPLVHGTWWAAVVVFGTGLSDVTDGVIARRAGTASWIGGHLDAVADKTFVIVALLTCAHHDQLRYWQVALLLSRDIAVLSIAAYTALTRQWIAFKRMPSRLLGKLATTATFAFLILLVAIGVGPDAISTRLLFPIAAALSALAGLDYVV